METITHSNAAWADDEPLTVEQIALIRVVGLTLAPAALPQLNALMDEYNEMAVAAFVLHAEHLTWPEPSLKQQFDACYVGTFDNWERCRQFLVEHVLSGHGWLRDLAEEKTVPLIDLVTRDDAALRDYLPTLGLQLIDTGESYVLFHRSKRR